MSQTAAEIIEAQRQNCIFCKIISKEIPSKIVYEDDTALVILDINPANEGHMLVMPKEHYHIMPAIPNELLGHLFMIAKKMSLSVLKGLSVQGTTTFVANGALAGQKAPHFMLHVIPRNEKDGLFRIPKNHVEPEELMSVQKKLLGRLSISRSGAPAKPKQEDAQAKEERPPEEIEEQEETAKPDVSLDDIANLFR